MAGYGQDQDGQDHLERVRVAVADRSLAFCRALEMLLSGEPDLEYAGCAGTVPGVFDLLSSEEPNVLLIDSRLAGGCDGPLVKTVHAAHPEVGLLLTDLYGSSGTRQRMARDHGCAYIAKNAAPGEIAACIRSVAPVAPEATGLRARVRR